MGKNSTERSPRRKADTRPSKPHKDFPLYAHVQGRWAKKVRGKVHYFTYWRDDPKGEAALAMWLDQKDDLLAGRDPRAKKDDELTVAGLCNEFLTHKEQLRDNGELSVRTFRGYYDTCERIVKTFGRNRVVNDLIPNDFATLRKKLATSRKATALRNEMQRVRSLFKFAFDEGLILAPVRFGQSFAKPKKETVRREREEHRAKYGDRMFEAHEIRAILTEVKQPLGAMVLLAANCGFGQSDLAQLPTRCVDLDKGWVDFARVKTAVPRRIPLWPETIAAIRDWLPNRPAAAKDRADSTLLFLTVRGARWVKVSESGAPKDAIAQEFNKVLRKLKLKRPGVAFYALRHGFETIAGETADQVAVDAIMGHVPQGMSAHYRERISDDRLRRVVDYVRSWLFADGATGDRPEKTNSEISDPSDPATREARETGSQGAHGSQKSEQRLSGDETDKGPRLRLFAG